MIALMTSCGGDGSPDPDTPTTATYTISGTVSGLTDAQNFNIFFSSSSDQKSYSVLTNGSYSFSVTLPKQESSYSISLTNIPSGKTCVLSTNNGSLSDLANTDFDISCLTNYSVGGTITGLSSALTLKLTGWTEDFEVFNLDGGFTFGVQVPDGYIYNLEIESSATDYCEITNGSGKINSTEITNIQIVCEPGYRIGGFISNLNGTIGVNTNGNINSFTNVSSFESSLLVPDSASYSVSIATQPSTQTCSVDSGSTGTVLTADVSNVSIQCVDTPYYLSGYITGVPAGTTVVLSNNADSVSVTQDGSFNFTSPVYSGNGYYVTSSVQGLATNLVCSVENANGLIDATDITNINVSCSNKYTVGGSVTNLGGSLVLQNNLSDDIMLSSTGGFTFATALDESVTYSVSVLSQPMGQSCSVVNGQGAIATSNVGNVSVNCVDVIEPVVINDTNGDFPALTLSASVGNSARPGTKAVTISISGLEGVVGDYTKYDANRYICVTGMPKKVDDLIELDAALFCIDPAEMVFGDYVKTFDIPYGTYAVTLTERYNILNENNQPISRHVRTIDNQYLNVKVKGPVLQNTFIAQLSQAPTQFNMGYSNEGISLLSYGSATGFFLNPTTNQTKQFTYPDYSSVDWNYPPASYGKYIYWLPGNTGTVVSIKRFNIESEVSDFVTFPVHSYCANVNTGISPLSNRLIGSELRGVYSCSFDNNGSWSNGLIAWAYDLVSGLLVDQKLIDSSITGAQKHYKETLGGVNFDMLRYINDGDYVTKYAVNLKTLQEDGCYDEINSPYVSFSVIDPNSAENRCVIKDPVQDTWCVEVTNGSGICDTTINGFEYQLMTEMYPFKTDVLDSVLVLSDGLHYKDGAFAYCRSPGYRFGECITSGIQQHGYERMSYIPIDPAAVTNASNQGVPPLSPVTTLFDKVLPTGEIAAVYSSNSASFLSVGKVNEDVAPPGIIPTGEVDDSNNRYFKISNPDYSVSRICAFKWAQSTKDCVTVSDSQRFLIHQNEANGGQLSDGAVAEIEGPSYDRGIREIPVASYGYGDKTYDPKALLIGTWTLQNAPGTVTITFTEQDADGDGNYDGNNYINVPGYAVENRPYNYWLVGNKLHFWYKNEPTAQPESTVNLLNATDLTLTNPSTGTGYYKRQ